MIERVLVVASLILVSIPASAWEIDLHYGLTKWLALQAGYKQDAAEKLASNDQRADSGAYDAFSNVFHFACLGAHDENGSEIVRDHHFPTTGLVGSLPNQRIVTAGSKASTRQLDYILSESSQSGEMENSIRNFGLYLHTLQDSWSHQGQPDIPPLCDKHYAWAHPKTRGGWNSHHADLTYEHPRDVENTAEKTYQYLIHFLRAYPQLGDRPPRPFPSLVGSIDDFAARNTLAQKREWFRKEGFKALDWLNAVDLPADDLKATNRFPVDVAWNQISTQPRIESGVPVDAVKFITNFVNRWVAAKDFAPIVKASINYEKAASFLAFRPVGLSADQQMGAVLRFWRLRNHGRASAFGHDPMAAIFKAFDGLKTFDKEPLATYKTIRDAFVPLKTKDGAAPYLIYPVRNPPQSYAALLRFRHAPYDSVLVLTAKSGSGYRVVQITSMVTD